MGVCGAMDGMYVWSDGRISNVVRHVGSRVHDAGTGLSGCCVGRDHLVKEGRPLEGGLDVRESRGSEGGEGQGVRLPPRQV